MIDVSIVVFIMVVSGFFSDFYFRKFKKNGSSSCFLYYMLWGFVFLGGLFYFFIGKTNDYIGVSVIFLIMTMILGSSSYAKWKEIKDKYK